MGLAALAMVLLAPVASAVALGQSSHSGHECCQNDEPKEDHCARSAMSTAHQTHSSKQCDCHIAPADSALPGEAVALTGSTFAFGATVAAQTNLQIDIPLAREPDGVAAPAGLRLKPVSPPLYLLNSVLLL